MNEDLKNKSMRELILEAHELNKIITEYTDNGWNYFDVPSVPFCMKDEFLDYVVEINTRFANNISKDDKIAYAIKEPDYCHGLESDFAKERHQKWLRRWSPYIPDKDLPK
jgi:hypothetical protein